MSIDERKHWQASRSEYFPRLLDLISQYKKADIIELGAGRRPSFQLSQMPSTVSTYTVNDISQEELSCAPDGYHTACFDVSGDATKFSGRFDVVFSRFLAEHVSDGRALHKNAFNILKPGGVAFHLIPTLFASPFVLNLFVPEAVTHRLLTSLFPERKSISPKFPAFYSYCRGDSKKMRSMFQDIGYSSVNIRNFYGHFYYDRIPILRHLEGAMSDIAAKRDWTWYASYAFITAQK